MTTLRRLLFAFAAVAGIAGGADAQQRADSTFELSGVVQTSDGRPISDADVVLLALASTRTDSAGRFAFRGVPRGTVLVRVQRLGLAPIMQAVVLGAEPTRELVLRFGETAATLAEIVVRDSGAPLRDPGGFEMRRRTGHGVYFSESDLTHRSAKSVEHILNALPGLEVDTAGIVRADRGRTSLVGDNCKDGVQLFVDGVAMSGNYQLREMNPASLRGIEVYRGVAALPVELRSPRMACGTVALWTK